jgi:hypothetical protein
MPPKRKPVPNPLPDEKGGAEGSEAIKTAALKMAADTNPPGKKEERGGGIVFSRIIVELRSSPRMPIPRFIQSSPESIFNTPLRRSLSISEIRKLNAIYDRNYDMQNVC